MKGQTKMKRISLLGLTVTIALSLASLTLVASLSNFSGAWAAETQRWEYMWVWSAGYIDHYRILTDNQDALLEAFEQDVMSCDEFDCRISYEPAKDIHNEAEMDRQMRMMDALATRLVNALGDKGWEIFKMSDDPYDDGGFQSLFIYLKRAK